VSRDDQLTALRVLQEYSGAEHPNQDNFQR
jgi:hypothetical protein